MSNSKESTLIKDFRSKDVNRMRNLIGKKSDQASGIQIGYTKNEETHKEGDEWEENGKTWTIRNGIKMSISRLQDLKDLAFIPLACPKCKKSLKHHLDKKMYKLHKTCLNCVISYESELKMNGEYEEYEKEKFNSNLDNVIKDIEDEALDFLINGAGSIRTEDGEEENWGNNESSKEAFKKEVDIWVTKLKKLRM